MTNETRSSRGWLFAWLAGGSALGSVRGPKVRTQYLDKRIASSKGRLNGVLVLNLVLVGDTGSGPLDCRLHLGPRTGFELRRVLRFCALVLRADAGQSQSSQARRLWSRALMDCVLDASSLVVGRHLGDLDCNAVVENNAAGREECVGLTGASQDASDALLFAVCWMFQAMRSMRATERACRLPVASSFPSRDHARHCRRVAKLGAVLEDQRAAVAKDLWDRIPEV